MFNMLYYQFSSSLPNLNLRVVIVDGYKKKRREERIKKCHYCVKKDASIKKGVPIENLLLHAFLVFVIPIIRNTNSCIQNRIWKNR